MMADDTLDPGGGTPEPRRRHFKPGNTGPDGDYINGKNRPPQHTKFAKGDGRRRGRRPKGQRNFDTELIEEASRKVTIREGGKERRVTKLQAAIIRALDNAGAKGQHQAIATIFAHMSRIGDKPAAGSSDLSALEDALLDDWLAQRLVTAFGDPEGPPEEEVEDAADGSTASKPSTDSRESGDE